MVVAVQQNPVLAVRLDRPGQGDPLDVGAQAPQAPDVVAVRDADHVLLDDRAGVELLGHVVRGRSDQLTPRLLGSLVRLRAGEGG